jgi:general L-amino acid transport system substrate-binding protein
MNNTIRLAGISVALVGALSTGTVHAGAPPQSTLDAVRAKGFVQCGVNTGLAGFSQPDSKGEWRGLDVDLCRAVAAAVFGDATKVRFTPLTAQQRFTALQSGEIDVLSRNTTWTLSRDTSLGFNFTGATYYDGQGFMVPRKLNIKSAKQLNGATVCVQPGTTTELNLADQNVDQHLKSTNPAIQRVVGATGDLGKMLGVDNRWAYNIIKQVGNYGESFDRNLTPLGFDRGLNRLWTQGGLMYGMPIR